MINGNFIIEILFITKIEKDFELYNVNDDPYEKYELSEKYPDVFESMKKTFDENPLIIGNTLY